MKPRPDIPIGSRTIIRMERGSQEFSIEFRDARDLLMRTLGLKSEETAEQKLKSRLAHGRPLELPEYNLRFTLISVEMPVVPKDAWLVSELPDDEEAMTPQEWHDLQAEEAQSDQPFDFFSRN